MNNYTSFFIAVFFHLIILIIFSLEFKNKELKSSAINSFNQMYASTNRNMTTFDLVHFDVKRSKTSFNQKREKKQPLSQLDSANNNRPVSTNISPISNLKVDENKVIFIKFSEPPYPRIAREKGMIGMVKIQCYFDENGIILSAKILESSGHKILDDAVKKEASYWKLQTRNSGFFIKSFIYKLND